MIYSLIDVIKKIIGLREKVIVNYENLLDYNHLQPKIKTIVKILILRTNNQIQLDRQIQVNYERRYKDNDLEINIIAYDTISKMVDDYKIRCTFINYSSIKDLLEYAVNIEQNILSVLFELKNKLYIKNSQKKLKLYELIDELITKVQGQIRNYKQYIKD